MILLVFLLFLPFFYFKRKKLTTIFRNIYLFLVNSCWFISLMLLFEYESRPPKFSGSASKYIFKEYINRGKSFSKVWNTLFQRGTQIDYQIIFLGFCLTVLLISFIDFKSINKYCCFTNDKDNNKSGEKIFYNLDSTKVVLEAIITVTTLASAFVVVLYTVLEKKSIPKSANFGSYLEYTFQVYLIPLLCAVNYVITKNKSNSIDKNKTS